MGCPAALFILGAGLLRRLLFQEMIK